MKKFFVLFLTALSLLFSCGKVEPVVPPVVTPIQFQLSASHPDETKAVKTGWENGDVIFVFFNIQKVAAPKYLKMLYENGTWTSTEMNGSTASPGCLGLVDGDHGTMRAVFLPFGNDASVSANGGSYEFSKVIYSYYLTATLSFTVTKNTVSGAFDMAIPTGYVQFFVEDNAAVDGTYSLGTDAVVPVGVASVAADGSVSETTDMDPGDDMPGYAYGSGSSRGYLFSGKRASNYNYGNNFYFSKTKAATSTTSRSRADYFVMDKELSSNKAVKLPANSSASWQAVGKDIAVKLTKSDNTSLGTWYTCNKMKDSTMGFVDPEDVEPYLSGELSGITLPTETQFTKLIEDCTWVPMSVHGQAGWIVKSYSAFLFMPAFEYSVEAYYWLNIADSRDCVYISSTGPASYSVRDPGNYCHIRLRKSD